MNSRREDGDNASLGASALFVFARNAGMLLHRLNSVDSDGLSAPLNQWSQMPHSATPSTTSSCFDVPIFVFICICVHVFAILLSVCLSVQARTA